MRKALIGITPLIFTLAACSQSTPKATSVLQGTPTTAATPQQAASSGVGTGHGTGQPEVTPPAHPLNDAQVHEIMELTGTDKLKEQLTAYIMRSIQQAPFMPKDVIDDMHASLEKADVNTPAAATYKKYLSTEDASTIIAFYKTPAGHNLVKVTPQIMSEVERGAMQTGQQIAHEVVERHRPEIEAAQKAYQAQHAPPTLGAPAPGGAKTPTAPATTAPKPATPQG